MIMSERDSVHKEIEKLQEEVNTSRVGWVVACQAMGWVTI